MGQIAASFERGAHLLAAYLEPTTTALGITQAEAHVLAQLARRGPTSIATLHREFGHKRSTLTNVLDRLEARKLVRREANPADRRSLVVHPTAAGKRTARRVTAALDQLEREVRRRVDERDLAGLEAVAAALAASLYSAESRSG
jgi:DNA-binding MarR family transcriptional regulator